MRILVIGGGGREHALCWKLADSERSGEKHEIHCAPGNAGIAEIATCHDVSAHNIDGLSDLARRLDVEMVVIGPEVPLTLGLADELEKQNIMVVGPSAKAARLEGSKAFMKDLCASYDIPTARYESFSDPAQAKDYISKADYPIVIKADGLAAGKGVVIPENRKEAHDVINTMLSGSAFGEAGQTIVIEEFLEGPEISFFALCDGENVIPFGSAEDHKRAFDNDKGPNTGGMGAFSPSSYMDDDLHSVIMDSIIFPTLSGLKKDGVVFKGVLYAGLILVNGTPHLLEYNTRFGDPECQVLLMRLESDLAEILRSLANGQLDEWDGQVQWRSDPAVTVVMAAKGYPGTYEKNTPIEGLDKIKQNRDLQIFHAGTRSEKDGAVVSSGGRVLNVACLAETIEKAREGAYECLKLVDWPEGFYRRDIAFKAISEKTGKKITQ